jgi:hypothetical protein
MTVYDDINNKTFAQLKVLAPQVVISVIDDLRALIKAVAIAPPADNTEFALSPAIRAGLNDVRVVVANPASSAQDLKDAGDAVIAITTAKNNEKACLVSAHDGAYSCYYTELVNDSGSINYNAARATLNTCVSFGVSGIQLTGNDIIKVQVDNLIAGVAAIV